MKITISRIQVCAVALLVVGTAVELFAVLRHCGGHFIYALDDPYIHLSVASNLLHGTYGVNRMESSSPSSSVLWPWIIAFGLKVGLGAFGPLIFGFLSSLVSVWFLSRIVVKLFPSAANLGYLSSSMVGLALVLATSSIALPFTGMEHSLHVMVVVVALNGLIDVSQDRELHFSACAAIAVMPLVRFEGMAFALAAIVALWLAKKKRKALFTFAGLLCGLAAYAILVVRAHLPWLPSSVTLKSNVLSGGPVMMVRNVLLANVFGNMVHEERASLLGMALLACVCFFLLSKDRRRDLTVMGPVIVAVFAHILAGPYGWFGRYEVYVMVMAAIGVLYGTSRLEPASIACVSPLVRYAFACLFTLQLVAPYLSTALKTPAAANAVYFQQYQMARFAKEYYKGPVAVNDLGLVSYRNPSFVLDLFGLGSEEVRKLKKARRYDADSMDDLAKRHGVGLVMIYPDWFDGIPADWTPIASMKPQAGSPLSPQKLVIYATSMGDAGSIRAELHDFAEHLPAGDSLQFVDEGVAPPKAPPLCPSLGTTG